jgi:hypothetical protein
MLFKVIQKSPRISIGENSVNEVFMRKDSQNKKEMMDG